MNRIDNEVKKYDYNLFSKPYYKLDKVHFRVDKFINSLILNYQNCMNEDKMNCQSFNGILLLKKTFTIS